MKQLLALSLMALLGVASPASAYCGPQQSGNGRDYPKGQHGLVLCQQDELAATVRERAALEQLDGLRDQLRALQLEQQRAQLRPLLLNQPQFP